jgi:hypothetical protein
MNELRTWIALRLAKDVETCCSLLRGEPVDPSGLDPRELEFMRELRLVTLDVRAIDLFEPQRRNAA